MTVRTHVPTGAPIWIDIFSSDVARTEAFYGALFGWEVDRSRSEEFGGYRNFTKDGHLIAGCMGNDGSGAPDMWSVYLQTDDAARTAAAVAAHGGTVFVPPMPVGDLGTMAVFGDVGGATIGAWQPGTHGGCGILAEPGAPAWFELHTQDYLATVAFYREVFGWDTHTMSDTPEFRYTTLLSGDDQQAGIMDASVWGGEVPAQWSIYFNVADADASIAQAVELGATLVLPAENTPYGRIAHLTDPTGVGFKLQQLLA